MGSSGATLVSQGRMPEPKTSCWLLDLRNPAVPGVSEGQTCSACPGPLCWDPVLKGPLPASAHTAQGCCIPHFMSVLACVLSFGLYGVRVGVTAGPAPPLLHHASGWPGHKAGAESRAQSIWAGGQRGLCWKGGAERKKPNAFGKQLH